MTLAKINVLDKVITIYSVQEDDFISLTDIARFKDSQRTDYIIQNWLRNRNTVEFLGIWERLNNPHFNPIEFDGIKNQAGLNSFVLTAKQWIEKTGAIGLVSKTGRYGGTYAHKDIAFEFATWVSVEFKLYLIKEFQRLKDEERKQLGWDIRRNLAKINYHIHTDAIKENLIPAELTKAQINSIYASEADLLNMALFGMTAVQWREAHPDRQGNIRDDADVSQLVCLANLESFNALFIQERLPMQVRLERLNKIAIQQMRILTDHARLDRLGVRETAVTDEKE
ncbi:MAG TPA: KilA-N domain-containing protein [Bacillota bacterium]|nr:KilA-N domain-containing protein [Bacillota bacterium]